MSTRVRQYQDTRVDVKIVVSSLWVAMLFVFAYVDIFGFFRADLLHAALDGKVQGTSFTVGETFLTSSLVYVAVPALMVALSLLLRARVNRPLNVAVSLVYLVTVIGSCVGEDHLYYLAGSALEAVLLVLIARIAWTWPRTDSPAPGDRTAEEPRALHPVR
jgi:hypothetical protein